MRLKLSASSLSDFGQAVQARFKLLSSSSHTPHLSPDTYRRTLGVVLSAVMISGSGGLQAVAAVVNVVSPRSGAAVAGNVEFSVGFESSKQAPVTRIDIELDGDSFGSKPVNPPRVRGVSSIVLNTSELTTGFHGVGFFAFSGKTLVGKSFVKIEVAGGRVAGPGGAPKLDAGKVQAVNLRDGEEVSGQRSITLVPDKTLGSGLFVSVKVDGALKYLSNRAPYQFSLDSSTLADGKHKIDVQVRSEAQDVVAERSYGVQVANSGTLLAQLPLPKVEQPVTKPDDSVFAVPETRTPALPSERLEASSSAARASVPDVGPEPIQPSVRSVSKPIAVQPEAEMEPVAMTSAMAATEYVSPQPEGKVEPETAPSQPVAKSDPAPLPLPEPSASPALPSDSRPVLVASLPVQTPDFANQATPQMPLPEPVTQPEFEAPEAVATRFEATVPNPVVDTSKTTSASVPAGAPPRPESDEPEIDIPEAGPAALAEPVTMAAAWREDLQPEAAATDLAIPGDVAPDALSEPSKDADEAVEILSSDSTSPAAIKASSPEYVMMAIAPRANAPEAGSSAGLTRPSAPPANAAPTIRTYVYSRPVVVAGSSLMGLREAVERLGGKVSWDHATKTATATIGDAVLTVDAHSNKARMGRSEILGARVKLKNDRLWLTADSLAAAFGVSVDWNLEQRQVKLTRVVEL